MIAEAVSTPAVACSWTNRIANFVRELREGGFDVVLTYSDTIGVVSGRVHINANIAIACKPEASAANARERE